MPANKTIRVSEQTRDDLQEIGSKGDTYDDVVRRLIEIREQAAVAGLVED